MKKTADIRERIAVRAYFAWLNGSTAGHHSNWNAEAMETTLAQRRAATATRAAQTRRANRFSPELAKTVPAEMLVAAKRRPTIRPTAH